MFIFLAFSFWHILVSCMWLSHFHLLVLPFKYIYDAKCLIYIHLCTFYVKENSARLQWYSCARYKDPGPLVSNQKHPPYLLHRMFKTYMLTDNIKVNTTMFLSMGFMKLATKNHGAGHLPPRRFIFNWLLLTRSFLLIPHCSFFVISCDFKDYGAAQHLQMLLLSWQMRDIGRWDKQNCVENHTNHVLRYKKLLLDDKSGMMKNQTSSHSGIKPLYIGHCDL